MLTESSTRTGGMTVLFQGSVYSNAQHRNATTFDEYWRKWNRIVHEWMLRHVFIPLYVFVAIEWICYYFQCGSSEIGTGYGQHHYVSDIGCITRGILFCILVKYVLKLTVCNVSCISHDASLFVRHNDVSRY